jgi:hypothetical protein
VTVKPDSRKKAKRRALYPNMTKNAEVRTIGGRRRSTRSVCRHRPRARTIQAPIEVCEQVGDVRNVLHDVDVVRRHLLLLIDLLKSLRRPVAENALSHAISSPATKKHPTPNVR